jgi:hypothetical protein
LEEKRVPYRIEKVTMFCYGDKESWYKRVVPSGMLPALQLDGRVITESDDILFELEQGVFCVVRVALCCFLCSLNRAFERHSPDLFSDAPRVRPADAVHVGS